MVVFSALCSFFFSVSFVRRARRIDGAHRVPTARSESLGARGPILIAPMFAVLALVAARCESNARRFSETTTQDRFRNAGNVSTKRLLIGRRHFDEDVT